MYIFLPFWDLKKDAGDDIPSALLDLYQRCKMKKENAKFRKTCVMCTQQTQMTLHIIWRRHVMIRVVDWHTTHHAPTNGGHGFVFHHFITIVHIIFSLSLKWLYISEARALFILLSQNQVYFWVERTSCLCKSFF